MTQSFYEILGVKRTATTEEIEAACLDLGGKYHLDNNKGNLDAAIRFKQVEQAYEILGNPEKRAAYDQSLLNDAKENKQPDQPKAKNTRSGKAIPILILVVGAVWLYSQFRGPGTQSLPNSTMEPMVTSDTNPKKNLWSGITIKEDETNPLTNEIFILDCVLKGQRIAKCKMALSGMAPASIPIINLKAEAYRGRTLLAPALLNGDRVVYEGSEVTIIMPEGADRILITAR